MNNIGRTASTLFLFFLITVPLFSGDVFGADKAKGKEIDLSKTAAYIKEMENRPDFPVSIVLANDYVYSLKALGETIQPARKKSILAYLKGAQQKDGGFINTKADQSSTSLFTEIALETLAYLDSPGEMDIEAAKKFILSLKNPDGGFGFSAASRESTIATTYYAVKIFASLNALSSVDKAKTAEFMKGFERKDTGGFGYSKGTGIATAKATYMAVYPLSELGMLDTATRKNSIRFLEVTPCGIKSSKREMPDLNEVYYALAGAKVLKSKESMDVKRVMLFLSRLHFPENGSFGAAESYPPSPDATTTTLRILTETGKIKALLPGKKL